MAHHLDVVLLAPLANASASTGLMLSPGTWVFVVTVVAPLIDIALGLAVGFPLPVLSLLGVGMAVEVRRMAVRRATTAATAARPTPRR